MPRPGFISMVNTLGEQQSFKSHHNLNTVHTGVQAHAANY
jgi:hypothetical protein